MENIKQAMLDELNKEEELDKFKELDLKIDRLEEYLDKIYNCLNKSKKEEKSIEDLPKHNLKKRSRNQKFEDLRLDIFSDTIIVDKEDKTPITSRDQMNKNVRIACSFVDRFDEDDCLNLLFFGSEGTGKTFLSNHIANFLIDEGYTIRKYSTLELFDFISEAIIVNRQKNLAEYKMLTECDLLIIDDLGMEVNNTFTKKHLCNILDSRFLNCKKTIICTNLSIKEIADNYDSKIFSRIIESFYICKFSGEDLRFKI